MSTLFHHLFTPQKNNNFRAKLLHLDVLVGFMCVLALMSLFIQNPFVKSSNVLGVATDVSIDRLYSLTNEKRVSEGLSVLTLNAKLSDAARRKAADMFQYDYWAHNNPQTGATPWTWIKASGYTYELAGENLAKNFLFSNDVIDGWMNSPTHRANILKKEFKDVGFAVVNGTIGGEETTLVVQTFGTPVNIIIPTAVPKPTTLPTNIPRSSTATLQPTSIPVVKGNISISSSSTKPNESVSSASLVTSSSSINQDIVIAKTQKTPSSSMSGTKLLYNGFYIFIFLFIVALLADWYIATHNKLIRLHSKNLAHIVFIIILAIGVYIMSSKGSILP